MFEQYAKLHVRESIATFLRSYLFVESIAIDHSITLVTHYSIALSEYYF